MRPILIACCLVTISASLPAADQTFSGRTAWELSRKSTCGTLETGRHPLWHFRGARLQPGGRRKGPASLQCARHQYPAMRPQRGPGAGRRLSQCLSRGHALPGSARPTRSWITGRTHGPARPSKWCTWPTTRSICAHPVTRPTPRRPPRDATAICWPFSNEIPLFYDNPLGGDFQDYVGGTYHAMEIFNDFYSANEMLDPKKRVTRSLDRLDPGCAVAAVDEDGLAPGPDGDQCNRLEHLQPRRNSRTAAVSAQVALPHLLRAATAG